MTPEEWARVRALFDEALTRAPGDRRPFVESACGADAALRDEVLSLLHAHDTAAHFLDSPACQIAADLLAEEAIEPLDGRQVGPYIIRHEIGRGGMGVVYLADDTRLARRVALKAIVSTPEGRTGRRERLRREARAASALSHPGIATIYALEDIDGDLYLASEYVPGPTLRESIDRGPLPLREVVDVAVQLARALAAAHAQGVVHRDLKPENLIRTGAGVLKVLDFGVATLDSSLDPRVTVAGAVVGTPAYMSPEQIRQQAVDFRSDLFAFGVVVYEITAGVNPFQAESSTATIASVLEVVPPRLAANRPSADPVLDAIVARCLEKRPEARYGSTAELVADLERLQLSLANNRDNEAVRSGAGAPGAKIEPSTSLSWWDVHQIVASIVYVLMIYPAWRARVDLPKPWDMVFFFAVLASSAAGTTVRLHLVFTSHFYPAQLLPQRNHARLWAHSSDFVFSSALLLSALAIATDHPEMATLLFVVSIAAAISALVIEPATARGAFGRS